MTETEISNPTTIFQLKSVIWTLVTDVRFKFFIKSVTQSTVLAK